MRPLLALALVLWPGHGLAAEAPAVPTATAVLFNTVCAECHELECSGRLSFCSGAEAARNHLERHAGPLTADEVRDLWRLLDYTKRNCAYVAPEGATPADGIWRRDELSRLALGSGRASFIPLGTVAAGAHDLTLSVAEGAPLRVEVLTNEGTILDQDVAATARLPFVLTAAQPIFVRLRGRQPFALERLALDRGDGAPTRRLP